MTARTTLATLAPNVMADAVTCTGCHEPQYLAILPEWTTGYDAYVKRAGDAVGRAAAEAAAGR